MDNKEKYYQAMKNDHGCLDETDLGERIGLDVEATMKIISSLLSDYKIEYIKNGACNYRIKKQKKYKNEYTRLHKIC